MKLAALSGALAALALAVPAAAQQPAVSDNRVRIGVLTDMSGLFSDISGPGAVEAIRMAVEDYGGSVLGKPVEVLIADHQNKADIAAGTARRWFDVDGVDMVADLMNSAAALAVMELAEAKDRIAIVNGASTSVITNEKCTPNSVHYTWDTYAIAKGTTQAVVKRGGDSWFLLVADYAFGHQMENDLRNVIEANGGKVLGSVRHPLNTADFSSFLLQAQGSGAKVIGLANAGTDTVTAVKQAN